MGMRYFKDGKGYIGVTTVTPKGSLRGLVFAGRGPMPGKGVKTVHEQAYAACQLAKLQQVDACAVPDNWFDAIGLEKRPIVEPPEPEEPRKVELVLEWPRFTLDQAGAPYLIWLLISFIISCYWFLWR